MSNGKISDWMPFHGLEFFQAVKAYPDYVVSGYLKAIWHYWHHEHAKGLPNESEMLRKICEIDKPDWKLAQSIIFDDDKFFHLSDEGRWHQKRACVEHDKRVKFYEQKFRQTEAANKARHGRNWKWKRELDLT